MNFLASKIYTEKDFTRKIHYTGPHLPFETQSRVTSHDFTSRNIVFLYRIDEIKFF